MLAIQIKGKHIFCKSPVHYWTKENLLTTCNHEFTLQTCRSLLQKLCLVYNEQFAAASFGQHQNPSATTVFRWGCVCKEPPDEHSQSWEGWSGRMPAHAHIFKGDWFWAKMLWLTPCPESTRGRKFPASLLKWSLAPCSAVAESSPWGMWRNTFSYSPSGVLGSFSMKP